MSESAKKPAITTEFDASPEDGSILSPKEIKVLHEIVEDIMDEYMSIRLRKRLS